MKDTSFRKSLGYHLPHIEAQKNVKNNNVKLATHPMHHGIVTGARTHTSLLAVPYRSLPQHSSIHQSR